MEPMPIVSRLSHSPSSTAVALTYAWPGTISNMTHPHSHPAEYFSYSKASSFASPRDIASRPPTSPTHTSHPTEHSNPESRRSSRIDIADLLCRPDDEDKHRVENNHQEPAFEEGKGHPKQLHAITEEETHTYTHTHTSHDHFSQQRLSPTYSRSYHNGDSQRTSPQQPQYRVIEGTRRDSGHVDSRAKEYTRDHPGPPPSLYSSTSSSSSSASSYSSTYSFSRPAPTKTQRSASLNIDHYADHGRPYDTEKRRTDRSNSDYALHQQNYGPYLDASPPLAAATLFNTSTPSTPPSRFYVGPPSPRQTTSASSYLATPQSSDTPSSAHPSHGHHPHVYSPRPSIQDKTRRPSQGPILPTPKQAVFAQTEKRNSPRIYGIDAADAPPRLPPPAPSASYGSGSPYSRPEMSERDEDYVRRRSIGHDPGGYHRQHQGPPSGFTSHAGPPSPAHNRPYPPSHPERRTQYGYDGYDIRNPEPMSTPPQVRSRAQSPATSDIKPPSWYHHYAHSVPPKPPSPSQRSSFSHSDPYYYSSSPSATRRDSDYGQSQQRRPSSLHPQPYEPWSNRSSFSSPSSSSPHPHSLDISGAVLGRDLGAGDGSSQVEAMSRRPSKLNVSMSASHSVHPFDLTDDAPACKSSTKRDRDQEEDGACMPEEGVKAKRKRANASQLSVLNAAFERSYFPSTEERLRLSKECRMCPRTVQIWFQNKRQSVKARSDAMDAAVAAHGGGSRRNSSTEIRRKSLRPILSNQLLTSPPPPSQGSQAPQGFQGEKRRSSGPLTPSDAVMASLQIQLDGRSVDYFSRKRRATIAKMER